MPRYEWWLVGGIVLIFTGHTLQTWWQQRTLDMIGRRVAANEQLMEEAIIALDARGGFRADALAALARIEAQLAARETPDAAAAD